MTKVVGFADGGSWEIHPFEGVDVRRNECGFVLNIAHS